MKKLVRIYVFLSMVLLFNACKTQKEIMVTSSPVFEEKILDTMVVSAPVYEEAEVVYELEEYQASATRKHDLIHTKLEVSFDWANQYVLGKAELKLKPYFYPTSQLELDAKVFDIHSIKMNGKILEYDYDFSKLKIKLDRIYTKDDEYTVSIEYTAKPNEGPSGGSAAITSDKGLFFINPLNENPNKPQQIWTQGETENSSRWFPTIDKPNERCSQEIYITVENRFQTLSNGKLMSFTDNGDGTRTDYWKQDKPHAPYLFMMAIGEYAVVNGTWRNLPLMYYVEPAYEKDAESIFNHTPEMLEFFSKRLDYAYPWDKYAQVICRDYVSGAMENTGAVVFGEFVQKTSRELLDGDNDDIVAHEMFHHWFGDLVTCESWSNLTLNEGFATYSEYLWKEYKYGLETAEKKRLQDLNGYIMSASQGGTHDLIDFQYNDKEQMFDGHSYNKGGLIVHMLRSYIGDKAFFAGLNRYLTQNEYSDVEAHELRLAFEDVVGEDLNWFFNQWFYDKGHPVLDIEYSIDPETNSVYILVEQTQDPEDNPPIFKFPVETALYYPSGKVEFVTNWIDQREQELLIELEGDELPVAVVLDGKHDILAVTKENRSEREYVDLFLLSKEYEDKLNAVKNLKGTANFSRIIDFAINDPSKEIRSLVVSSLDPVKYNDKLKELALNDESSSIRAMAIKSLKDLATAEMAVENDLSFKVISEALGIIYSKDPDKALKYVDKIVTKYHRPLITKIAEIYASTGNDSYLDFFEKNVNNVSMFGFFNFINQYGKIAKASTDYDKILATSTVLKNVAMDKSNNYFKKYSATNLINSLITGLESKNNAEGNDSKLEKVLTSLKDYMYEIINTTTDSRLKSSFQDYLEP